MDRVYLSNTSETPPEQPPSAGGFPTAGSRFSGVPATVPGAYWFHSVTEEIRNVITGFGLTPDASDLTQLYQAIMAGQHPVGSIYMSMDPTDPSQLFGGTWTPIRDRVLIGAGGSYTAGATGGSATAQLTLANLPSHSHGVTVGSDGAHTHSGSAQSAGDHTHTRGSMEITGTINMARQGSAMSWAASGALSYGSAFNVAIHGGASDDWGSQIVFRASNGWSGSTSSNGAHTHGLSINSAGSHTHSVTIQATGSGTAFSIMPPYIAAYMWYRTA